MTPTPAPEPADGMTMDGMHAKPKDHLWVLAVIAAACLIKVWPSWVGIGAEARFPEIIKMPTDWTLAVVVEAYWAYAVYAWLAASAGRRSRKFAMWSAGGVFLLSLTAQSSASLMSAKAAGAFANAMPVTILALIAVLVHLRHLDRAEAARAEEAATAAARAAAAEAAEASELAAVRAELEAARAGAEEAHADLSTARTELARTAGKVAALERKLAAQKPKRTRTQAPAARRTKTSGAVPHAAPKTDDRTMLPDDFDAREHALELWLANPDISGKELGETVGMKERWGQLRKNEFAAAAPDAADRGN